MRLFCKIFFVFLFGCDAAEKQYADAFIKEVKARPVSNIQPTIEQYAYTDFPPPTSIQTDPFKLSAINRENSVSQNYTIENNLEPHSLEALKMIGIIENTQKKIALISLPNGKILKVSQGDYLKAYQGRVQNISKDKLTVVQKTKNSQGKIFEKQVFIVIAPKKA